MKTNKYRSLEQLMTQELLVAYQKVIADLAFLLAIRIEFSGKDAIDIDTKTDDEAASRVSDTQSLLYPLIDSAADKDALAEMLFASQIATKEFVEDILSVYDGRKEVLAQKSPLYDRFDGSKETFEDTICDFFRRLVICDRMKAWIDDLTEGIENNGLTFYLVPENADAADMLGEKKDVFQAPDEMDEDALLKEILAYQRPRLDDSAEDLEDKKSLLTVIGAIAKERGEKKHE